MLPDVIVLNGGSSSGKSTLAKCLQATLPGLWLTFSIDSLVDAMPPTAPGIGFGPAGEIAVGARFRTAEAAWMRGIAAMTRHGVSVVVDDVFLSGATSQDHWRAALDGVTVAWVGVRCDPATAVAREASRPDRITGMARSQATTVHDGVSYDVEVDTTDTDPAACAAEIGAWLAGRDA